MTKGELILLVADAYHEEGKIKGLFRATHDFNSIAMFQAFVATHPAKPDWTKKMRQPDDGFAEWAVELGYLEPVEYTEDHFSCEGFLYPDNYCAHANLKPELYLAEKVEWSSWEVGRCVDCGEWCGGNGKRPLTEEEYAAERQRRGMV